MPVVKRLRGYCDVLDLRPIHFQENLPDEVCCSMCDVIPVLLMRLPCGHNYCGVCHEQIVSQTTARCPLDQKCCDGDSILPSFVRLSVLEKKRVRCINANDGCTFVGALESLKEHFQVNCQFHVVICGRCAERVPQKTLLLHRTRHCRSERTLRELQETNADVGKVIERLSVAKCATEDNINSVIACAQAYAKVTNDLRMLLENCLPHIRDAERDILQRVGNAAVFEPSAESQRKGSCILRNFSGKLRSAATYTSDVFNVAGCPIQVCQTFVRGFGNHSYVYLGLLTSVATVNNASQWPVRKTFFLVLVHPEDSSKNVKHAIMPTEVEHVNAYFTRIREEGQKKKIQRPLDKWFATSKLLSDGYVVDDSLRVTVETEG